MILPNDHHVRNTHRNILTTPEIIKNVSRIKKFDDIKNQKMCEALIILKERPSINQQNEDFSNILKLY